MGSREQDYRKFAHDVVADISRSEESREIYAALCETHPDFSRSGYDRFRFEITAAQLAAGCLAWEQACRDNGIEDAAIGKAFFKSIMESFESPKSVELASAFSHYLQRTGFEDDDPLIGMARKLRERLEVEKNEAAVNSVSPAFAAMIGTLEGFKASLESRFEAFVQSLLLP